MIFPLYDNLLQQVNDLSEEKQIDITRVCYTINNIYKNLPEKDSKYHYKMIGYLIIHHKLLTDKIDTSLIRNNHLITRSNKSIIPYNSQIMMGNKGILLSMEDLPSLLQKIIAEYVEIFSL